MTSAVNDNYRAVSSGSAYYPEMGERHDGKALFVRQVAYKGYNLKWSTDRHTEALAVFKSLRIRARYMSENESVKGGTYWSCGVTWDAGEKVRAYSATELLLD